MYMHTYGKNADPVVVLLHPIESESWFYLQIRGKTVFPRWMAFTNVLVIFAVLKGVSLLMPVSAFRLGFTNGLMSESMIIWFGILLLSDKNGCFPHLQVRDANERMNGEMTAC